LEDRSGKYSPDAWAREAMSVYSERRADRIVAEVNQGGAVVENTIRTVDRNVSYRGVHASRGKAVRAEPIAALYEQRRVHHVGPFPVLEDQLCAFTSDFDHDRAGYSPDRLDALVWALTDLTENFPGWGLLEYYRLEAEKARAGNFTSMPGGSRSTSVRLRPRSQTSTIYTMAGAAVYTADDGTFGVSSDDAPHRRTSSDILWCAKISFAGNLVGAPFAPNAQADPDQAKLPSDAVTTSSDRRAARPPAS
jgi:Terminase RNaseH-like domain